MAFKCANPRRATIFRESGIRTFNHSTGSNHSLATPVEETPGQQPTTVLNTSQSFAEHYMGVKMGETKLLGRPWNKTVDTIKVAFPVPIVKVT